MLGFLAAALMAPTPVPAPPSADIPPIRTDRGNLEVRSAPSPAPESEILESAMPWWEKITVTVDDKGEQQSCRYQASYSGKAAEDCDEEMAKSLPTTGRASAGVFSKLTFERRFSPSGRIDGGRLQPGDKLLGRQVIFITFSETGAIDSCHVVGTTGDTPPSYDCDDARKEQFRVQASAGPAQRQGFMTILAYGHKEQVV